MEKRFLFADAKTNYFLVRCVRLMMMMMMMMLVMLVMMMMMMLRRCLTCWERRSFHALSELTPMATCRSDDDDMMI